MREIVLDLQDLTRRFGAFTAVDRLTLSVNAAEVFGLLGSNGAGKTTTIKMLTTLLPPSSGEAHVAGFSITTQAVDVRRAIGYVPQAVSVDGSLTGYENLLIFAKLSHRHHAGLAEDHLSSESLDLFGGCLANSHAGRQRKQLRPGCRLCSHPHYHDSPRVDRRPPISSSCNITKR